MVPTGATRWMWPVKTYFDMAKPGIMGEILKETGFAGWLLQRCWN